MTVYELRQKQVINCRDGQVIGCVYDVDLDFHTCKICAIIVPGPGKICGILGREHEYIIDVSCIVKIGSDVILVNVDLDKSIKKCASD